MSVWLSFAIIFSYLIFTIVKFGIPRSISDTYYLLGSKGWIFQIALALTALSVLPVLLELSSDNTQFLAFLSCAGLLFVSTAPMFKFKTEGVVHYISAGVCCFGLLLWQIFNSSWITPASCVFLACIPMLKDKKYIWWLEIATIVSSYISMILY